MCKRFIIITPTRNESEFIGKTIECMLKQTLLPLLWVIVDDGSSDDTPRILKDASKRAQFIKVVVREDRGYRKPGEGVVDAFYTGFNAIAGVDYDVVAKFDADLEFPPDTLEKIGRAFEDSPKLGITGAVRYDRVVGKDSFSKVLVPKGFVGGPTKFYRRECYDDIKGLIKRAGWDGVDTIRANMKGWDTGELDHLKVLHLKPTGSATGEGLARACEKYGDVSYYMGGYLWYFLLRVAVRSIEGRSPFIGYHMVRGYWKSKSRGVERESREFREFLKKTQLNNVRYWIKYAADKLPIIR